MNLGDMRTECKRRLGNMQASDIFDADVTIWLNRGVGDVVIQALARRATNFDLFQELTTSWESPLTADGDAELDLPQDKYAITGIHSYDKATTINRAADRAKTALTRISPQEYELLDKAVKDFPRLWAWEAKRYLIWPTPSSSPTDYRTYLALFGLQKDKEFTSADAASNSYLIDSVWHGAVVAKAAFHGSQARGWFMRADQYAKECDQFIARAVDATSLSYLGSMDSPVVELDCPVTRATIYGS